MLLNWGFILLAVLGLCSGSPGEGDNDGLCFPLFHKRAFVTSLTPPSRSFVHVEEEILKIKVLLTSLRGQGNKEDLVVIAREKLITKKIKDDLNAFGVKIHVVSELSWQENPQSLAIWSFELTQYDRIIYLNPFSLVLGSIDSLFACGGYCAASNQDASPVVLEPSLNIFTSLRRSSSDISLQRIRDIESCPLFSKDSVLDATTIEKCQKKEALISACYRLPEEFSVPSGSFVAQSVLEDLACTTCGFEEPKIVVYPSNEHSWESFLKTKKAIMKKWDDVRSLLPISAESRENAAISFSISCFFCFLMIYFHENRNAAQSSTFHALPSTNDPLPVQDLKSTYLVCRAICSVFVQKSELSPRQNMTPINSSSQFICRLILTIVVSSIWYHLALVVGQFATSFEWDPLASLTVSYCWTTLVLLCGFQMIDTFNAFNENHPVSAFREPMLCVVFCGIIFFNLKLLGLQYIDIVLAGFCLLSVLSLVTTNFMPASRSQLVQKEDISMILFASLVYYMASYAMTALNVPVVLQVVLVRYMGMVHYVLTVFIAISIIFGDELSIMIQRAVLFKRASKFNVIRLLRRFYKFLTELCCRASQYACKPTGICFMILALCFFVVYVKLFLSRGVKLPRTSPYFCLRQRGKYLSSEGGVSSSCGAREAFSLFYPKDVNFSETFSQQYACIGNTPPTRIRKRKRQKKTTSWWRDVFSVHVRNKPPKTTMKYLDPIATVKERQTKLSACSHGNQFVFTLPAAKSSTDYCLYNPRSGRYLTSSTSKSLSCGQSERWEIVPTHTGVFLWRWLSKALYPLKYRFSYLNPFLSISFIAVLWSIAQRVEHQPFAKITSYCTIAVLLVYLFHVTTVWMVWGSNFENVREFNTDAIMTFQRGLGVPSGPQYYRTITMLPDECPETLWLSSLILFSSSFPTFLILLALIQFRSLTTDDEPTDIVDKDYYEEQSTKDLSFNISIMSRLASCAVASVLLEALLNLVVPVQFLGSTHMSKSSCADFESRFGLIGHDKEYVDTVLLFTNVIFVMGMKFSTSRSNFIFCLAYTIVQYLLVWLTVECSYFLITLKFFVTAVSWLTLSPKLSSYFELLILKVNRKDLHRSASTNSDVLSPSPYSLNRQLSLPNILSQDEPTKLRSPKKWTRRNNSSKNLFVED